MPLTNYPQNFPLIVVNDFRRVSKCNYGGSFDKDLREQGLHEGDTVYVVLLSNKSNPARNHTIAANNTHVWFKDTTNGWEEIYRYEGKNASCASWSFVWNLTKGKYAVEVSGYRVDFFVGKRKEEEDKTGLQKQIEDLGRRVDDALMGFRRDLDNALSPLKAAQDALRKEIDGIWNKLYGWLVDRILNVLLSALDRTADAHVRETYKIVPEGPAWSRGEVGTPDNATTLPFDPEAVHESAESIAEMRNQAWKSKRGMM